MCLREKSIRQWEPASLLYSILIILPLILAAGCHKSGPKVAPPTRLDPRIGEYSAKGDEYFQHKNLYGWRMAEDFYARAHAFGGAELKDKLLLTRVLRIAREIDEGIATAGLEKALASDCASPVNARQQAFCEFALRYQAPRTPVALDKKVEAVPEPDLPILASDTEDLEAYLHILYSQAYGFELPKSFRENASENFKSSPLFLYLNLRNVTAQPTVELEKSHPDFAELYVFNGERRMQTRRYRESRAYFNKALELVPDFTRAINGLGNISLFVLEDYVEAMRRYETTLKFDPTNTGALYGKGLILHSIGRFAESNQVFDMMLSIDIGRGGRLDDFNVHFYRGMGRYYQAYNYYRLSEPQEARNYVDLAKKDLPNAESINYLSGVFYFNANQMDLARADFEKVLAGGNVNCEAQNYLGLIYLQTDEYKAVNFFLAMCSCVESAIKNIKHEIESLPSLDLEAAELINLKTRIEEKLSNFRISAADMIKNAIAMVDLTSNQRKDLYRKLMEEALQRVTSANGKGD